MTIVPGERNYVVIRTVSGSIHVYEEDRKTKIYYYDHASIVIEGTHKNTPKITIDSDEFPTILNVEQSESEWIKPAP